MIDVLILKIILVFVMVALTVVSSLLPIKVLKTLRKRASCHSDKVSAKKWPSLVLCLLSCFTGGVFLATCFLHLLPEVIEHFRQIKLTHDLDIDYPIAELTSCCGFFLVFFLEEIVILFIRSSGGGVHQGPSHVHVHFSSNMSAEKTGQHLEASNMDEECSHAAYVNGVSSKKFSIAGEDRAHSMSPEAKCLTDFPAEAARSHSPCPLQESCSTGYDVPARAEPECCEGPCDGRKEDPPVPVSFRPHAHHHGVRSFSLVLALSLHSVIEGLAFGIQDSADKALTLFVSIIFHKLIVAFSTGLQLARTHPHRLKLVVATMVLFSFMSPIGCAIGIVVESGDLNTEAREVLIMLFEGLSVGTFLYVTFFEVFIHERDNEHPALLKLLATIVGYSIIAAIRVTDHHEHNGSPNNSTVFNNVTSQ